MALYLTTEDAQAKLRDDFAQLYTLPDDQDALDKDLADADGLVNAYLRKRYALPVTDAEALRAVRAWSIALFCPVAYQRNSSGDIPEKVKLAEKNARADLSMIATGAIKLPGNQTEAGSGSSSGSSVAVVTGNEPQFTHDKLDGF